MFIPLAPTTTTTTSSSPLPSPSTSPLDDGITTVGHYIYVHSQRPQTDATHQDIPLQLARQHQMQIPLYIHQHPVLTDAVQKCVDTAAEAIATHREAKIIFMQGLDEKNCEGGIQRIYTSPFSWDSIRTVS